MFKPQLFGGEKVPAEEVCKVASQKGRVAPLKNPWHTKKCWALEHGPYPLQDMIILRYPFNPFVKFLRGGVSYWPMEVCFRLQDRSQSFKGEEEGSKYNIFQVFGTIETSCNRWPPVSWFRTCSIPIKCFMHKSTYLFTSFTSQQHPAVWHASHIPYIANAWLLISIG